MSDDEIRIAIAEACGWVTHCFNSFGEQVWHHHSMLGVGHILKSDGCSTPHLPDYCNDLNACHEAEKIFNEHQQDVFAGFLAKIVGGYRDFGATKVVTTTKILFATPRQHCEAFLRTVGKWPTPGECDKAPDQTPRPHAKS